MPSPRRASRERHATPRQRRPLLPTLASCTLAACTLPEDRATPPARVPCTVVLTDAADRAWPEPLQSSLRIHCRLLPADHAGGPSFPAGPAPTLVPPGSYQLQFQPPGKAGRTSTAPFTIAPPAAAVRVRLEVAERVVVVTVRGALDGGYALHVSHEAGFDCHEPGRPSGHHTLLLPPGPALFAVTRPGAQPGRRTEVAATLSRDLEQAVTVDAPPP
jgi:hypothetical protein